MKKHLLLLPAILVLLAGTGKTYALEVRMEGDRLTLQANQVRLQEVLARIAERGVQVRIDADINPVVSASFDRRDIQRGLSSILKSTNYALLWKPVEGPLGPMTRLAEIQVFKPGKRGLMKPIAERSGLPVVRDSASGNHYVANEILLRLEPGMTAESFLALLSEWGATVADSYPPLGLYKVRLPGGTDVPAFAERLSRHRGIEKAEPNFAYPIAAPYRWELDAEPAPEEGRPPVTGTLPIAILDSGLSQDAGLEELVVASLDAIQSDETISDPLGHGTQMALIASGRVRPHGVPGGRSLENRIIPIRAFDEKGYTSDFTIMTSIAFASEHGARVVSLSWGTETESGFLEEAFRHAESTGMVLLASAGNEPTGRPVYPAAYPSVLGVGALAPDGEPWEKSNHGDFVTLAAPGFATLPGHEGAPGSYAGTSISTAYAANVMAGYLSLNPKASVEEILRSFSRKE